ncbi:hypothetical protein F4Z99_19240 [Candidatus Poribacteria bacterium]|nr:hypothetical protein [Candidatus Poribacteria bacterium]MYB00389.1 hypothetical protein [Candidatus Poribacteria bacterium]
MSIFKKIKRAVQDTAEKAKDTVENTERQVEQTVSGTVDTLEDTARKLEDIVQDLNPAHIAEDVKREVLQAIRNVKNEAVKEVKKVSEDAISELKDVLLKIEGKLAGKTAQEVLHLLVDVVKTANPSDVSIHLGPLTLDIGNVVDKIGSLEHYAHHPPETHSQWKAFIKAVSPESLSIVASVGFAFIIESSDLEVGIEATWTGEDVIENVDKILSKAGIH